jgi:hypothetical protein
LKFVYINPKNILVKLRFIFQKAIIELKRNPKDKNAIRIIFSVFKIYFDLRSNLGEIIFSFYKREKALLYILAAAGAGFGGVAGYYGLSFLIAAGPILITLFIRSHSQQVLALAQQKDYEDIIKMTRELIKSKMDKINSEVSVYKAVEMKVPALVRKEWEMSEQLQQLAQNLNFNAKKAELSLSDNARLWKRFQKSKKRILKFSRVRTLRDLPEIIGEELFNPTEDITIPTTLP